LRKVLIYWWISNNKEKNVDVVPSDFFGVGHFKIGKCKVIVKVDGWRRQNLLVGNKSCKDFIVDRNGNIQVNEWKPTGHLSEQGSINSAEEQV
jgi:hypothetical protein